MGAAEIGTDIIDRDLLNKPKIETPAPPEETTATTPEVKPEETTDIPSTPTDVSTGVTADVTADASADASEDATPEVVPESDNVEGNENQ